MLKREKYYANLQRPIERSKTMKEIETNIIINGDYIIYNGVKYEKVKKVPSEQPFKLRYLFAEALENAIGDLGNYDDFDNVMCHVDTIADHLLNQMSEHIPDYSDWKNCLPKEVPNQILPSEIFRLGWNAYCKKMWDMINDD